MSSNLSFFIVTTFSSLFLFSKPHIYKEHKSPQKTKVLSSPTGRVAYDHFVIHEEKGKTRFSQRLLLLEFVLNKRLTLGRGAGGEACLFPPKIRADPFDLGIRSLLSPGWWPAALQPVRYRPQMAWRRAEGPMSLLAHWSDWSLRLLSEPTT